MPLGGGMSAVIGPLLAAGEIPGWLYNVYLFVLVIIGFSIIIFVHELGHFLAAKWVGVRVDRFAVGFGYRLFGYRRGEGFTFGNRPDYNPPELKDRGYGETDYCFKALPIGGYVRMLGQDDIIIDDKTGDVSVSDDPRAFPNRPVGQRMIVVSAGVVFNLLLAGALLAGIFLYGTQMDAPMVTVLPGSSAYGELQTGDRVLSIDGAPVEAFRDIILAPILSDGSVSVTVERNGEIIRDIVVDAPKVPDTGLRSIGVAPYLDVRVAVDGTPVLLPRSEFPPDVEPAGPEVNGVAPLPAPRKGDLILDVNSVPVANLVEFLEVVRTSGGGVLRMTVERPASDAPGAPAVRASVFQIAELVVTPDVVQGDQFDQLGAIRASHLLGLHRRPLVLAVGPGSPAGRAGMRPGDVIVEWDTIPNPTYHEILASIRSNAGTSIRFVVERGGTRLDPMHVTPKQSFRLFGQATPKIEASISFESAAPVVADVEPNTPAAELNLPRGARLLAIDGAATDDWHAVYRQFARAAGRQARLVYQHGDARAEAVMLVPGSIVNALELPPTATILRIDGKDKVTLRGRETGLGSAAAVAEALRQAVGRTVKVEYRLSSAQSATRAAEYVVVADEVDPWQMRVGCSVGLTGEVQQITVSAHGNPLTALRMSTREVFFWVIKTYQIIKQMVSRDIGVQHMSGPVGIFGAAIEQARASWMDLLYFMAYISINLAVLNFLPIPVMDGGLMVFLLIEKIKGKPLSLKTQMVTTLVGLAAILLVAILVTVQDIGRLF